MNFDLPEDSIMLNLFTRAYCLKMSDSIENDHLNGDSPSQNFYLFEAELIERNIQRQIAEAGGVYYEPAKRM